MIQEILSLLRSKNRCLSQLLEHSEKFGNVNLTSEKEEKKIDDYNRSRSAIMKAVKLFDDAFNEKLAKMVLNDLESRVIEEIKAENIKSEILCLRISEVDQLHSRKIKESMDSITKKLNDIRKHKNHLQKFYTPSVNGDEVDTTF